MDCFKRHHSSLRLGRNAVVLLLLLGLMASCAPKRVVRGQVEQPPQTRTPAEKESTGTVLTENQMPRPQSRGKIIPPPAAKSEDPVETLQLGLKAASLAQEQLDKPYQWGGTGPEKFDCSGLVYYVFGSLDVSLPRVSRDQARAGQQVKRSQLQPGDLVFFITSGKNINHVGIYVGDSRFIHAPRRYSPVRYDSLNNSWWRQRFQFGRRISG